MSKEPTTVDLAVRRRGAEAFDRHDIDGVVAMYRPDAVFDMSPVGMGVFEGHDEIRGFYEDWRGLYEDFDQVIEETRDLGNGVGFSVVAGHGRLRGSASRLELHYASVLIWADGLVERHTNYTDIDQARAAAERLAEARGSNSDFRGCSSSPSPTSGLHLRRGTAAAGSECLDRYPRIAVHLARSRPRT